MSPSRVDLPLPDGPTIATVCFWEISNVMSCRIGTVWPAAINCMATCWRAIMNPFRPVGYDDRLVHIIL